MAINVVNTNASMGNISRNQVVDWINDFVPFPINKVEDLSKGFHYCILMDYLFPKTLGPLRIKTSVNQEHEFLQNLKELQNMFNKTGVDKIIPIEKLAKSRFQDNYEFVQWFYKFFIANYDVSTRNETEARHRKIFSNSAPKTSHVGSVSSTCKTFQKLNVKPVKTVPSESVELLALRKEFEQKKKDYDDLYAEYEHVDKERNYYYNVLNKLEVTIRGMSPKDTLCVEEIERILFNSNGERDEY